MSQILLKPVFFILAFVASGVVAISTGCSSGGFKLTRQYARWVNSQNIILRIVIYLLTGIVFLFTILADMVIFNTIDFWSGTVSGGSYEFKKDGNTFYVNHEFQPGTQLKKSTIEVKNSKEELQQTVVLLETPSHEIQLWVDGKLRTTVENINSFPIAKIFNAQGVVVDEQAPLMMSTPNSARILAKFQ